MKIIFNLTIARIYLTVCSFFLVTNLLAGPADNNPVKYSQPDGNIITIKIYGDEYIKWAKTLDEYTILLKNGFYEYAGKDENGDLVPSGLKVKEIDERSILDNNFLKSISKNLKYSDNQIENIPKQRMSVYNRLKSTKEIKIPTKGNVKMLCILVEFQDIDFRTEKNEFDELFNQIGYYDKENYDHWGEKTGGSVYDYWKESSWGQLDLTTDIVGPYKLSENIAYYGGNLDGYRSGNADKNPRTMVEEAIKLASNDVDFSDYDSDGDGFVDGVYIIYGGLGEHNGGSSDAIWAHRGWIDVIEKDGVKIKDYGCSSELRRGIYADRSDFLITTIGTICHEIGHLLGAPDFYDMDGMGSGLWGHGTNNWDLMTYGSKNGDKNSDGSVPAHPNIWSKWKDFDWISPIELKNTQKVSLGDITYNEDAFYYNTKTEGEYWLLENRQLTGFNKSTNKFYGGGLLIYHVNETGINNNRNSGTINNGHPQNLYVVSAGANTNPDGKNVSNPTQYSYAEFGAPFPGKSNITQFSDATIPSSISWDGEFTESYIDNIREVDGTIQLDFKGAEIILSNFTTDVLKGICPFVVNFTDLSGGNPISWYWDFGDGNFSDEQNPSHTFTESGIYSVTLIADNGIEKDTLTKNHHITVVSDFEGEGTLDNPYQISTLEDLTNLSERDYFWDKHFILTEDIDAGLTSVVGSKYNNSGKGFTPIGIDTTGYLVMNFSGTFNGNNHIISNLYCNSEKGYIGLFAHTNKAKIHNLGLENVYVRCSARNKGGVGALVASANATEISECFSTGYIESFQSVGGLCGAFMAGRIKNSYSNCTVIGERIVGGLIGHASYDTIVNCYSSGEMFFNIEGYKREYFGGLTGGDWPGEKNTNSYWDIETSGVESSSRGFPLTSSEFGISTRFVDWDFENVWRIGISPDDSNSRPRLKWQTKYVDLRLSDISIDGTTIKNFHPDTLKYEIIIGENIFQTPFIGAVSISENANIEISKSESLQDIFYINVESEDKKSLLTYEIKFIKNSVTKIKDIKNENINIYPNPFTESFVIDADRLYKLKVTDITGRLIFNRKMDKFTEAINMRNQTPGIYLLKLSDKKSVILHQIIKK